MLQPLSKERRAYKEIQITKGYLWCSSVSGRRSWNDSWGFSSMRIYEIHEMLQWFEVQLSLRDIPNIFPVPSTKPSLCRRWWFIRSILLGERRKPPSSPSDLAKGKAPNILTLAHSARGFDFKTEEKHLKKRTQSPGCSCCVEQTDSSRMPVPFWIPCKMPSCCDRYSQGRQTEASCTGSPFGLEMSWWKLQQLKKILPRFL